MYISPALRHTATRYTMYISPALRHLNATWEGGLERLRPPRRAGERGGNGAHAAQHMLEQHSKGARASPQQNMQEQVQQKVIMHSMRNRTK